MQHKLTSNIDSWNNDDYINLIEAIKKKFNLYVKFSLYEDLQGDTIDIDDMDDIMNSFEENDDTNQTNDVRDLYVKVNYT